MGGWGGHDMSGWVSGVGLEHLDLSRYWAWHGGFV